MVSNSTDATHPSDTSALSANNVGVLQNGSPLDMLGSPGIQLPDRAAENALEHFFGPTPTFHLPDSGQAISTMNGDTVNTGVAKDNRGIAKPAPPPGYSVAEGKDEGKDAKKVEEQLICLDIYYSKNPDERLKLIANLRKEILKAIPDQVERERMERLMDTLEEADKKVNCRVVGDTCMTLPSLYSTMLKMARAADNAKSK